MTEADRPSVHFSARRGWINDPLALTWHDDAYHLFYQYVPERTTWSYDCRWGHAVSDDLLNWRELPIALAPASDEGGAWSGCLVQDDAGRAQIFYTSVALPHLDAGRIRTARPTAADWLEWQPGGIVLEQPEGVGSRIFRDPFVIRDGDVWRMLVGGSIDDRAAILGFSSFDQSDWTYDGVAASRMSDSSDDPWTGLGWECPQLIRVDGVDVLIVSVWEPTAIHYVAAAVGTYSDGQFDARSWQRLTWGQHYYAGSSFVDEEGRPCLIYWIRDAARDEASPRAGALSVPHRLRIEGDRIIAEPHPNLFDPQRLRAAAVTLDRPSVPGVLVWPGGAPLSFEVDGTDLVLRVEGNERGRLPTGNGATFVLADQGLVEVWTSEGAISFYRL